MKKITLILGLFLYPVINYCQNWTTYSSDSKLKIEYTYANCHDEANGIHKENVFFKYTNLTQSKIEFDIEISAIYTNNEKEFEAKGDTPLYTIELSPNEIIEGSCIDKKRPLVILSKMLNTDASVLKNFTITINTKKQK